MHDINASGGDSIYTSSYLSPPPTRGNWWHTVKKGKKEQERGKLSSENALANESCFHAFITWIDSKHASSFGFYCHDTSTIYDHHWLVGPRNKSLCYWQEAAVTLLRTSSLFPSGACTSRWTTNRLRSVSDFRTFDANKGGKIVVIIRRFVPGASSIFESLIPLY